MDNYHQARQIQDSNHNSLEGRDSMGQRSGSKNRTGAN